MTCSLYKICTFALLLTASATRGQTPNTTGWRIDPDGASVTQTPKGSMYVRVQDGHATVTVQFSDRYPLNEVTLLIAFYDRDKETYDC